VQVVLQKIPLFRADLLFKIKCKEVIFMTDSQMPANGTPVSNYEGLLELLNKDAVLHQAVMEEKGVQIPTQMGDLDSVLFMRWQDSDGIIQFIQAIPLEISEDKLWVMADAITRLNHALAIPGFDLNHQARMLAYRLYLPIYPRQSVFSSEIQAMFRLTVKTASKFMPVFKQLIEGHILPSEFVDKAQRVWSEA